jgi:branched-chain amino acid transport system substrate-binding protein
MQEKVRIVVACVLAAVALVAVGCGGSSSDDDSGDSSSDKPFRLGLEAPLSGDQAVLGQGMLRGAQLAADELNAKDGILGRKVEIVPIDDAADPDTGVKAAQAAIDEGLDGVVGPYNSGVGVKTLPLYLDAGLVPIRLTSDDSTSGKGFTLQPMTSQIAPVASEALTKWLEAKDVAIVYDSTQTYTTGVSKALRDELEKAGVTVTAYEPIKPGEKSYSNVVDKVAAGDPDVIYAAVYFPEGGKIAKEMYEGKVKAQCVADYGSYDIGFVETAGVDAAKACPVVGVPAPDDFPGSGPKIAAYEEKFGPGGEGDEGENAPGVWTPYTYDSVNFLAYGAEQAGSLEPGPLTDALGAVNGWEGWTGSVTIDPATGDRDPATVVIATTNDKGDLHVDKSWAKAVGAPYE